MLVSENELLFEEWDSQKNSELLLDPTKLVVGSNKYAFWKCSECGNGWKAQIAKRGVRGQGCPVCGKKKSAISQKDRIQKRIREAGSLGDLHPELLEEWDYERNEKTPYDYLSGSNKSVFWICSSCGYGWKAVIANRAKGVGCISCGRKRAKRTLVENLISARGALADNSPSLAAEWDYSRNGELTPQKVMANTNIAVWWICSKCGYSWKSKICNRNLGGGCPKCSFLKLGIANSTPIEGINDLLSQAPELASELHPTKNGKLQAIELARSSNRKVWWLGKCGHEWQAIVASRFSGRGCPICLKEFKISYPEKAIYYYLSQYLSVDVIDNYRPTWLYGKEIDIYIPSLKLAIEYDGSNWHKNARLDEEKDILCRNYGVEVLRIREKGTPDLNNANIYLINAESEKDDELQHAIEYVFNFINIKYGIKSEYVIALPTDRAAIYALMEMHRKENSLACRYPEIAEQWNYAKNGRITPEYVNAHTHKKYWWICDIGHEYEMVVKHRVEKKTQCPICSSHRVLAGFNDLKTKRPDVAERWDYDMNKGLLPTQVMEFSNKKVWWKCDFGHSYERPISHETSRDSGCPICKWQKLVIGFNDLQTLFPQVAAEWNYEMNGDLLPDNFTPISHRRINWVCRTCGKKWNISINSRCVLGHGCPSCARRKNAV